MNSTDRYALIALLFLVVVVAVAAFWDDGDAPPVHADEGVGRRVARVDESALPEPSRRGPSRDRQDAEADLALAGLDDAVDEHDRVTTIGQRAEQHSVDPLRDQAPAVQDRNSFAGGARIEADVPLQPRRSVGYEPRNGASPFLTPGRANAPAAPDALSPPPSTPGTARVEAPRPAPAEPRATPAPSDAADLREYVVRSGDALTVIASRECGSIKLTSEIARLNGLSDVDIIKEGMTLKLPARTSSSGIAPAPTSTSPEIGTARADGRPVVAIAPGGTLSQLLHSRYGTVSGAMPIVKALNPDLDPDRVQAGQPIVLPRYEEVAGATPPADVTATYASASSESTRSRTGNYVR